MRRLLTIICFTLISAILFAQEFRVFEVVTSSGDTRLDSVPNRVNNGTANILVLGVKKFDSLVEAFPKDEDLFSICMEKEVANEITENFNELEWNYNMFNSNCYFFIASDPIFIWRDILPYLPEEYFNIALLSYPNKSRNFFGCFDDEYENLNGIRIKTLNCQTYLCMLMKLSYFNETRRTSFYPPPKPQYLFPDSEFLEGLYIKVLIPLKDEE